MAPASVTMPPQTVPSTMHWPTPEALSGAPQYPYEPPATCTQLPPQQSALVEQVSPVCWQYDPLWHVPSAAQNCEQQAPFDVHDSPSLWQPPGEGKVPHVPAVPPSAMLQMPLQHCTFPVQALPLWAQTKTQLPLALHEPLQQS
jgi:hypothetical protein